jgi:hypothetical protein
MSRIISRPLVIGRPQWIAAAMLFLLLVECLWLVSRAADRGELSSAEYSRLEYGLKLWRGNAGSERAGQTDDDAAESPSHSPFPSLQDGDPNHSALWYLTASAPLLLLSRDSQPERVASWIWLARLPSLGFGLMLGASLWYVARRLYGDPGGYVALGFYCVSPAVIRSSALWLAPPEMGAAWGVFGAIFTAIAVAHTLYAPREVVLWNWRRILLLGLSLLMAVGFQFSLVMVAPVVLLLMLYVAPMRRAAAFVIWLTASVAAGALFFAAYSFRPHALYDALSHAAFVGINWQAFGMARAYLRPFTGLAQSSGPALWLALICALIVYSVWPRSRYFGNTVPLLMIGLFLFLAIGSPHDPGLGFPLLAFPFISLFIAGIAADLLETGHRRLVMACLLGVLASNAVWNLAQLVGLGRM